MGLPQEEQAEGNLMGSAVAVGSPGFQHVRVVFFEDVHNLGLGRRLRGDFVPEFNRRGFNRSPFLIRDGGQFHLGPIHPQGGLPPQYHH